MITIKNKKKTLEGTVEEIWKLSLSYTEKYYPSKQELKTYLLKKYLKTSIPHSKKQDIKNLIDIVLSELEKTKFLSDKFFSESKARNLIQKGTSINKIRNYLISKGIQGNDIKDTINKINENNILDQESDINKQIDGNEKEKNIVAKDKEEDNSSKDDENQNQEEISSETEESDDNKNTDIDKEKVEE